MTTDVFLALCLFVAGATVDFLWVVWMRSVSANRRAVAAVSSMGLGALSLVGIGAGVSSWLFAAAWVLGLGAGTVLAMDNEGPEAQ